MVKGVTSHHLQWFLDGTHHGHYEAQEAGGLLRGVYVGVISYNKNLFGKLLKFAELLLCCHKIKIYLKFIVT